MRRRWAVAVAVAVSVAVSAPVVAATSAASAAPRAAGAHQVLLVAVPDLRWSDLAAMPHLRALEARSAVGELSVRSQGSSTRCGDAMLQLSAGTRVPSGVVDCSVDATRLAGFRVRYRHSRYDVHVGLLGDRLGSRAAAADSAAAVALSTSAGPPAVVPLDTALQQASVVVTVDEGLYTGTDRAASAGQVDARLAATLARAGAAVTVIVAGVSDAALGGPHLHPLLVAGPGWEHRELTSPTTGRAPYVQLFDLTATLLAFDGQSPPAAVSGRPIRTSGAHVAALSSYAEADRHARRALTVGHPTFSVLCGVLLGCLLLLLVAPGLARWPLRLLLLAPIATWLVQVGAWWRWPVLDYALVLAGVALVGVLAHWQLSRRGSVRAALLFGPLLAAVVLVGDQLVGAPLQLSAPFGDNPLVAGRFHGMGNIAFSVTMASLLLCTAVVAAPMQRSRRLLLAAGVGLVAVVVDGAPWLGDDLGGVLALVPAFAVLVAALAGLRVTARRVVAVGAAAVSLAVAAALLDYSRPESAQTHAGRFVGQLLHGGSGSVMHRKADAVANSFANPLVTILVVAVVVAAVVVVRRGHRTDAVPGVRAAALSVAVLAVVGSLLNDSGIFVAAAAFVAFVPAVALAALGDTRRL